MRSPLPTALADLTRQADAVATIIAICSGTYGVLLSVLYEPFGSADLFTFEAARWSAWLNIAAAVNAVVFTVAHRVATRRAAEPRQAFERVAFAALTVSVLISVGHVHIGGSQNTILPVTGVLMLALGTWFLPWRMVAGLAAVWLAGYATVVALEVGEVLPYAPIFNDGGLLARLFLDWRSVLGMSVMVVVLFGAMLLLLRQLHRPLHAARREVEAAVEARTEALREANASLDRHIEDLRGTPAEQRVAAALQAHHRETLAGEARFAALSVLATEAAGALDRELSAVHGRARDALRALEAHPPLPEVAHEALLGLLDALAAAGDPIARLHTGPRRIGGPRPPRASVSLDDLARDLAAAVRPESTAGQVRVQLELSRPPTVRVDRARVELALHAVLLAALAAVSGQRSRRVVLRTRQQGDEAVLEVHDSGDGPPAGEDPLAPTPDAPFAAARGAGVGLAIARRIVEGHGGTLTAGPSPHGGTAVRMGLPIDADGD